MFHPIEPARDLTLFSPLAARLLELLLAKHPALLECSLIKKPKLGKSGQPLFLRAAHPFGDMSIEVSVAEQEVEVRFIEKNRFGFVSVLFFMNSSNFHRTSEAAVDFIDKVLSGQVLVVREKKRAIPFFGPKRLRFFELGEIVGGRASEIERVLSWQRTPTG